MYSMYYPYSISYIVYKAPGARAAAGARARARAISSPRLIPTPRFELLLLFCHYYCYQYYHIWTSFQYGLNVPAVRLSFVLPALVCVFFCLGRSWKHVYIYIYIYVYVCVNIIYIYNHYYYYTYIYIYIYI